MKKIILSLYLAVFSSVGIAETQTGLDIMQEVKLRDTGWKDMSARLEMVLKNRNGDKHQRFMQMKVLEMQGDGDKSLSIFNSPKDVKGTAFLSFTHALEADEQWLYLPGLKRVKRISSSNKSGPFLGSEIAFEDLSSFELDKYSYTYLRDELQGTIDCFVIETKPQYEYSGYTRTIVWVDKARYIPVKIDYYDRKNSLLKTQIFNDYQQFLGKYWRSSNMNMENYVTGKSTQLLWTDYKFKNGFTKRQFDKNSLKRSR